MINEFWTIQGMRMIDKVAYPDISGWTNLDLVNGITRIYSTPLLDKFFWHLQPLRLIHNEVAALETQAALLADVAPPSPIQTINQMLEIAYKNEQDLWIKIIIHQERIKDIKPIWTAIINMPPEYQIIANRHQF